jgi:hypothetical protein
MNEKHKRYVRVHSQAIWNAGFDEGANVEQSRIIDLLTEEKKYNEHSGLLITFINNFIAHIKGEDNDLER